MAEGIVWHGIGTVDVTFDEKTYHLGRPKFRQFRYFTEKLEQASADLRAKTTTIEDDLADAKARYEDESAPEARAEIRRLTGEIRSLLDVKFYELTRPILAEMFSQVGDALPDDPDDWPAWLAADSTLPGEILKHWRTSPKASSEPPPS